MQVVAFDTETQLIRPGCIAPPLACVSWQRPGADPQLTHWTEAELLVRGWLEGTDLIVGFNTAFDMSVLGANFPHLLPQIFDAYEQDRVTCGMIRQKLLDIAGGCYRGQYRDDGSWEELNYSLDDVTKRLCGRRLDKDTWRLLYGTLRDKPLSEWPDGARQYPLEDARAHLDVFLAQEVHKQYLEPQWYDGRAAFWLYLMSAWGMRTRPDAVEAFRRMTIAEREKVKERLVEAGLVRPDGSRDTKVAVARMQEVMQAAGRPMRMTKGGVKKPPQPKLDGESCKDSEDPALIDYAEYTSLAKVIDNDCKMLSAACTWPVHTRFDMAASDRTTSSNPNIQNLRRLPGIRECFVPRPKHLFIDTDYNALELWSLAQICTWLVGRSKLGEVLHAEVESGGPDPHTALAAEYLGISGEEAVRLKNANDHDFMEVRRMTKQANFGFAGGMGVDKFVAMCSKGYGMHIPIPVAQKLRGAWFNRWDEMEDYFEFVKRLLDNPERLGWAEMPVTHFCRGGMTFSAAANGYFQHLGAAAAKQAGWLIAKACYIDKKSPLYGSRPVCFVHDQWITETPDNDNAHEAAFEQARLMREGARKVMPDFVPPVEPVLSRYWSKEAKTLMENGRLVAWPKAS